MSGGGPASAQAARAGCLRAGAVVELALAGKVLHRPPQHQGASQIPRRRSAGGFHIQGVWRRVPGLVQSPFACWCSPPLPAL